LTDHLRRLTTSDVWRDKVFALYPFGTSAWGVASKKVELSVKVTIRVE
jgi:hypothetical protein